MSKRVNKLLGLEIDEVSLVDRPANQYGLVTITKRDEGDPVDEIFDAQGNLIDPDTLEVGDVFYDEAGNEFEAMTQEQIDELEASGELEGYEVPDDLSDLEEAEEYQLAGVGKAAPAITGGARSMFQTGRKAFNRTLDSLERGYGHTESHVKRNKMKYGTGSAAVVGFGAGRKTKTSKSLGAEVLAELSKAYTDGDRDQIVSKAVEAAESRAQAAERRANIAFSKAERLEFQRETEAYVELAKAYDLPVDPEDLGPILQVIAKSGLSPEQLDTVDRIFTAAGDQAIYAEHGAAGIAPSSVMEQVVAHAHGLVGKADMSLEEATTALFEADDRAYLEYLAETGH